MNHLNIQIFKRSKYKPNIFVVEDLKPFKLETIDEQSELGIIEICFKPFHYTIFEDQEMVHVTVARQGGDLESSVLVKTLQKTFICFDWL